MRITIIDYGVGNVGALVNMLDFVGHDADVAATPADILRADKLILPGVGAFDAAMRKLIERDLHRAINEMATDRKIPVLGVCLGMQLLGRASEEGHEQGLALIQAESRRIQPGPDMRKVPHMGWADVTNTRPSVLFPAVDYPQRFYFAHSYQVVCDNERDVVATVDYGQNICVSIEHDNIFGVQFHPEKSHRFGARLLKHFAEL